MQAGLLTMLLVATVSSACATGATPSLPPLPLISEQHENVELADGEFARLMATHHRAVMDVALLDGGRGKSPAVKALATTIWQARQRELPAWEALKKLTPKLSESAASHERDMLTAHQAAITRMKTASPAGLDRMFVDQMLRLNEMASAMIDQADLEDAAVKQLAERFVETQRAEMKELRSLQTATSARTR